MIDFFMAWVFMLFCMAVLYWLVHCAVLGALEAHDRAKLEEKKKEEEVN